MRYKGVPLENQICATGAANVMLLTDTNFQKYKRDAGSYEYYGGNYRRSPVVIPPPRAGHYNLIVDLGGYGGSIKTSAITIIDI